MIRDILLAYDFSPSADRALAYGMDLVERTGATLHLLHVDEVPLGPLVQGSPSPMPGEENLLRQFKDQCHPDVEAEHLQYHVERSGSVAPPIVQVAETQDVDLIVMGTQGQRGLRETFLGSVAREVLRTAPCPVLTTRALPEHQQSTADPSINRIVAPIDFSDPSRDALRYTQQLLAIYDVPVKLVHVVESPAMPSVYGVESPKISSRKVKSRAERTLQEWAGDLLPDRQDVTYVVHTGKPAALILESAPSDSDLLVMATRGLSGLRRTMLGSVTEKVVCDASGPVLAGRIFPADG